MERTEAEKAAERLALQVLELDRNTLLVHLRFLDRALSRLTCVPGIAPLSAFSKHSMARSVRVMGIKQPPFQ